MIAFEYTNYFTRSKKSTRKRLSIYFTGCEMLGRSQGEKKKEKERERERARGRERREGWGFLYVFFERQY
jgi:hypothetical protein